MIMSIKCFMNGLEANYPCSPSCVLFGDCVTEFESQKKYNIRTNADRFRAMPDEEQQNHVRNFWEIEDFADWLRQPAEEG